MKKLYTSIELADMCKALIKKDSYYAVGKLLDVSANTVKMWYVAGIVMDDSTGIKVAETLNMPTTVVLISLQMERVGKKHNDKLSSAWRRIAEQIAA